MYDVTYEWLSTLLYWINGAGYYVKHRDCKYVELHANKLIQLKIIRKRSYGGAFQS